MISFFPFFFFNHQRITDLWVKLCQNLQWHFCLQWFIYYELSKLCAPLETLASKWVCLWISPWNIICVFFPSDRAITILFLPFYFSHFKQLLLITLSHIFVDHFNVPIGQCQTWPQWLVLIISLFSAHAVIPAGILSIWSCFRMLSHSSAEWSWFCFNEILEV